MADPLSVVGGVVGILSLAIEVTQTLYNYYTSLKGQSKEITSILGSLRTLHKTLECLCHDLKHSKFPTGDLDLVNNISDIVQRCEGYIEELKQEATKFENITEKVHEKIPLKSLKAAFQITSRRLRARGRQLAYPIQENTLKDLRTHINHLNTELCFAINLLQSRGLYRIEEKQSSQISSDKSLQIRDWLKAPDAPIDFHSAKSKRHVGTGLWFIKGPSFTAWLGQPGSFLLLSGFAGCGKTVLCSAAIEEVLSRQKSNSRIGVAYFYFTFSDESKQRASQMLRALVLQLSVQLGGAPPALEQLYRDYSNDSNHTPPDQAVLACLQKLVQEFCDVYIILDALDECPRGKSQRAVCQAINDIRGWSEPRLHLLVTSRDEVDICKGVKSTPEETIFMRNDGINKDIASWVSQRLCESPEFRQWETHSHKIKQALIEKADGIFRWVECQLEALYDYPETRHDLEMRLGSLPRTLADTYHRMLQNIPYDHQDDARRMLQALCSAVRPLTVSELTDILAIELDEKPGINPNRRRQNVDALRKSLPGFTRLEVNDETKEVRIRIAHLSVQEYLESERICQHQDVALFRVLKLDANALMARICLTLLLTPQLAAREPCYVRQQFPLAEYAARFWPQHFQNGSEKSEVENLITRLFLDSKGAFHNWLIIRNFDHPRIVQGGLDQVTTPTPFYYASKFGCVSTLTLLLHESSGHCSTGKTLPDVLNSPGGQDGTALQAASAGGYTEIVQLLLEKGADVNTYRDEFGSPLGAASCNGHAEVVQLLLRKGANVNADCSWYGTPLLAATSSGHGEVVRMLLDYDADLEAQDCEYGTPLHVASSEGYAEIVQILLNKGADVESKSLVYGKPLETAAYKGQYEIVRMLLCHLASTNAESHNYGEALQLASLGGHIDILRLLLQEGADINARDGEFGTALQAASSAGHTEVVRFLVDKGAEINATGGSIYGTALEAASNKGHIEIVKFLVDEGANINAACEFMTALQAASFRRYLEIVQLLISKEADANTKSRCFGTALQAAIMGKQAETVEWLRSTAPT